MKNSKKKFEDDGRTIVDMSFEGTAFERSSPKKKPRDEKDTMPMDKKQTMYAIRGALAAGLLIGLVFILAFFLFILFSTNVWLR
jgi:predicted lipid-binding transport protein (Tim44 family)